MPSKLKTARLTWEHKAMPRVKRMGSRAAQACRGYAYMRTAFGMAQEHLQTVKVTSAIAVWISAECAVDKSGKLNRYGGDSAAEDLSVFQSYAIYTIQ